MKTFFAVQLSVAAAQEVAGTTHGSHMDKLVEMFHTLQRETVDNFCAADATYKATGDQCATSMKELSDNIESLDSGIQTAGAELEKASAGIAEGQQATDENTKALTTAEADLAKEKKSFNQQHSEMTAHIDHLHQLKTRLGAAKEAIASMTEVSGKDAALAFVQTLAKQYGAMSVVSKGTSSEGVLGVIQSLLDKVSEEKAGLSADLGDLQKAHGELVAAYDQTIAASKTGLEAAAGLIAKSTEQKGAAQESLVQKKGEMEVTKNELKATADACEIKYQNHEFLTQKAKEDHGAFGMVVDTLASAGSVTNVSAETTFDCSTPTAPPTFLQRRAQSNPRRALAEISTAFARLAHVKDVSSPQQYLQIVALAKRASASGKEAPQVFERLVKRVEQMLGRLEEEAIADAQHHGMCERELGDATRTRDDANNELLESTSTYLAAMLKEKQLATMIEKGESAVEDARARLTEAATTRAQEKQENTNALQTQNEALEGCRQARIMVTDRVRDSDKAGEKFNRENERDAAGTEMNGSGSGVSAALTMLDSTVSKLAADIEQTKKTESDMANAYKELRTELEAFSSVGDVDKDHWAKERAAAKKLAMESHDINVKANSVLHTTVESLVAINRKCKGNQMTAQERIEARKMEIEQLNEAVKILEGLNISPTDAAVGA